MSNSPTPTLLLVLTTLDDKAAAQNLAQLIVAAKLAACVNIVGQLISYYPWEGKLQTTDEWQLICKTTPNLQARLFEFIQHHHPYQNPELIALPVVATSREYLDWVKQNVSG